MKVSDNVITKLPNTFKQFCRHIPAKHSIIGRKNISTLARFKPLGYVLNAKFKRIILKCYLGTAWPNNVVTSDESMLVLPYFVLVRDTGTQWMTFQALIFSCHSTFYNFTYISHFYFMLCRTRTRSVDNYHAIHPTELNCRWHVDANNYESIFA